MEIIRVIYQGFSTESNQYANCIMMIRREDFSVAQIYEISVAEKYPICSDIHLDILIEAECRKEGGEFWDAYLEAAQDRYSLTCFVNTSGRMPAMIPRFSEADFATIFKGLGGQKIPECSAETPDFRLCDIIMELKDIQQESLKNTERQENIAAVFGKLTDRCVDLDPLADYGDLTIAYHQLIRNSIHNHLKKASSQIKSYRKIAGVTAGGMIFLNTGMFSLPHELFKVMIADLLTHRTKTIEFVFVFSQVMQGNGFDQYAIFKGEFIGKVPDNIQILQQKVSELIGQKMTAMMRGPIEMLTLAEQQPISFEKNGKIYYWNPGQVPDSRFPS
ncbi:hypothetical protein [Mucilaginibacter sp. UR6-11]|uniref:hypothetical protein n=1 Tax=Mucilaginibacter sp. UR6-11 TaxID=1435644 RepID=UPI001E43D5E7|nr:hypothetical protein [Mucilaginibacter sp. UR6-11]MCC8423569.1 hypothetical protein [Mucilaginibacter sp. UR6-11]